MSHGGKMCDSGYAVHGVVQGGGICEIAGESLLRVADRASMNEAAAAPALHPELAQEPRAHVTRSACDQYEAAGAQGRPLTR